MSKCEVCMDTNTLYQHTNTMNLYVDTFGKARALVVECMPCPPYSDCCMKDCVTRSAFLINFCPECGRDLRGEDDA